MRRRSRADDLIVKGLALRDRALRQQVDRLRGADRNAKFGQQVAVAEPAMTDLGVGVARWSCVR